MRQVPATRLTLMASQFASGPFDFFCSRKRPCTAMMLAPARSSICAYAIVFCSSGKTRILQVTGTSSPSAHVLTILSTKGKSSMRKAPAMSSILLPSIEQTHGSGICTTCEICYQSCHWWHCLCLDEVWQCVG